MYKIQTSLAIAVCVAAGGCSGQSSPIGQRTPTVTSAEITAVSVAPPAPVYSPPAPLPTKTASLTHPHRRVARRAASAVGGTQMAAVSDMGTQDASTQDVSAVAKIVGDCPAYKHGHSLELRPDLAFEETGKDCQGDLPGRAFLFR